MKATKKFVAGALATAMALAVNVPAFAATITINNAAAGETYTAYKLFDMTSEDGKYSYYIENTEDNQSLITLLDSTIGLNLTQSADGSQYIVNMVDENHFAIDEEKDSDHPDGMTAAELAQALNTNKSGLPASTLTGTDGDKDGQVTISTDDTGYYFIDSTLGALCALYTNEDDATVNEKNTVPGIEKTVKEDSTGEYGETATIDLIDTVSYKLTVDTGNNDHNPGTATGVDKDFVITDTLPAGMAYTDGTIKVNDGDWNITDDYTVNYNSGTRVLTVTLLSAGKLKDQAENSKITITYDATVTGAITHGAGEALNGNHVILTYSNQKSEDYAYINTFDIGGNTITKVDGKDNEPLLGVGFVLSKTVTVPAEDGGEPTTKTVYATFDDNNLTGWVDTIGDNCKLTTDEAGHIYAYGLDADTYILTETDPLPGYNALTDTITVVINTEGIVTYQYTSEVSDNDPDTIPGSTITITNNAGTLLPSTGGMGTTVLYIAGIVLVLGAGVTLVVRRRMNQDR